MIKTLLKTVRDNAIAGEVIRKMNKISLIVFVEKTCQPCRDIFWKGKVEHRYGRH
jgi:hypothetical protein